MSLRYGVGGATTALAVVGACKNRLIELDGAELTAARYAIHWRRRSVQCELGTGLNWLEVTKDVGR